MTIDDPIAMELDKQARLLENNGYAVEVDYIGGSITLWTETWPIDVALRRPQPQEET